MEGPSKSHSGACKVLVLGGSGFIGAETVVRLLESQCEIYLAHRNRSWDWDNDVRVRSKVKQNVYCNRKRPMMDKGPDLCKLLEESAFDAVVDFSGYDAFSVREAVTLCQGRVGVYIYISTDSVYDVCDIQSRSSGIRETDAVSHPKHRHACKYGRKKLEGEDELRKNSDVPYVILRLADVIGPRDCTDRFWEYYLWLRVADRLSVPVKIPQEYIGRELSFTYTKDVADLINDIIVMSTEERSTVINEEYNISCKGTVTLESLLREIHKHISQTPISSTGLCPWAADTVKPSELECPQLSSADVCSKTGRGSSDIAQSATGVNPQTSPCPRIEGSSSASVPCIYPSVEKGGLLDTSKARSKLRWTPTPVAEAVRKTTLFYNYVIASDKFDKQKRDILASLVDDLEDVYPDIEKNNLKKTVKGILQLS